MSAADCDSSMLLKQTGVSAYKGSSPCGEGEAFARGI